MCLALPDCKLSACYLKTANLEFKDKAADQVNFLVISFSQVCCVCFQFSLQSLCLAWSNLLLHLNRLHFFLLISLNVSYVATLNSTHDTKKLALNAVHKERNNIIKT